MRRAWARVLLGVAAAALAGCDRGQAPPAQMPPPAVTVAYPVQKQVVAWDQFTGHLEAPEMVQLSARVSGLVMEAPFKEGALVHEGDLLYLIDPAPFQADLDARRADVEKAQAQVDIAQLQMGRLAKMLEAKFVSQQDYDNAHSAWAQATAALAAAKAAEQASQLNVEWTRVTAPITGRVSRKLVTAGNLITAAGGFAPGTVLSTIASIDPIYCYVDLDERFFLNYQRLSGQAGHLVTADGQIPAQMGLGDETGFPHEGYVGFLDNHLDAATGTIRARGVFANPEDLMRPGLFARMRLPASLPHTALLVPDSAVGTDQDSKYLLVVGADDKVEYHSVAIGPMFDGLRSIVSGIGPSDRVIVNGLMMARPGSAVAPQPTTAPATAPGEGPTP